LHLHRFCNIIDKTEVLCLVVFEGDAMNKIKQKLNEIKNKCGLALPLAGILAMGSAGYGLSVKHGIADKTELVANNGKEDTYKNTSDSYLMSILVMIEGCTLKAYTDDIGVWTYGIGNTKTIDGRAVKKGDTLKDNDEAFAVADHHIRERIDFVFDHITRDLTPEQNAALRSFAYNCGAGTLVQENGKLTELGKAVNEGDDDFVVREMLRYNKAGGSFMKGLFFRRALEAYVYQGFVPLEELQKGIIGGIGNVSCNQEMKDIFKLKETKVKKGRKKYKISATFDDAAITDSAVAMKLVAVCQSPAMGEISSKYADFHVGEQVCAFLPSKLVPSSMKPMDAMYYADVKGQNSCELATLQIKEQRQMASVMPDLGKILQKMKRSRSGSE